MSKIENRLIVALDVADIVKALDVVEELKDHVVFYKVGLELYLAEGKKIVEVLNALQKKVFLDLKFFDIPNTVYGAVRQALDLKPDMLTLHALGGVEMLKEAVRAKNEKGMITKLLGVTVLTSMDGQELGVDDTASFVVKMAKQSLEAGLDGVVCSSSDASTLRSELGKDFIIVCPGIRIGDSQDDQKRIGSPGKTLKAGADYLVVGRPVIHAQDRLLAVQEIIDNSKIGLSK